MYNLLFFLEQNLWQIHKKNTYKIKILKVDKSN